MRPFIIATLLVAFSALVVFVRRHRIEAQAERREISLPEATESLRAEKELWIGFAALVIVVTLLDLAFDQR